MEIVMDGCGVETDGARDEVILDGTHSGTDQMF